MRNYFAKIKAIVTSMVVMAVVASSVSSCTYDDTKLWNEINSMKKEIAQLRSDLNDVLEAISGIVSGDLTIKDVQQMGDGSQVLTLSDDTKITIYPKGGGLANIITTVTIDDVRYWAMYDGLGTAQPILINGNMIPVADLAPMTQVNDEGAIEVSFDGGKTWVKTGYEESITDTIITNVEVVYSDWQTDADGNPIGLYCIVTFADGSTMNVGMQNGKLVMPFDMLFVPYGADMPFSIEVDDVADFMTTTPRGWECEVEHKAKLHRMTLTFTAPTYEDVVSGAAVSDGVAKLMIVFNNGSSAIASIKLSTNPAKVNFTQEGLYLEAGYGTNYVLCGLVPSNTFNVDNYALACNELLAGETISGGRKVYEVAFMEESIEYIPYTALRSAKLTAGSEYIFWYVVPRTDDNGDLYVVKEEICSEIYKHSSVDFNVTKQDFFDVAINFNVKGSAGYMLGYSKAEEFDAAQLAEYYNEYPDYLNATQADMNYSGSFVELFDINATRLDEGTEYVAWYIAKPKDGVILVDNVLNWSFTTEGFTMGGDIEVSIVGDVTVEYDFIEMTLNTELEHIAFFYNAMPSYMASSYATDEDAIEMLTTEGKKAVSNEAAVARYDGAKPGDKLTFFAVAVDTAGKYGKIFKQEYTTRELVYNDLSLKATLVDYKIDDTRILLECEGAVSYCYVICKTSDEDIWVNRYGGTAKKAGEYMIKHYANSDVHKVTELEDGHICFSGLDMGVEYAIIIAAVSEDALLSKPEAIYFEPIANIGNVVRRDDPNWAVGKPTVEVLEYEDNPHLFYSFSWKFIPGEHTTAYSAAMFPVNFVNEDLGTNIDTVEKLIADLMSSCDTGTMSEQGKSCEWNEEGVYAHHYTVWEDTDNDGYLEDVPKVDYYDGCYHFFPYGTSGMTYIYTTWVGEDGNFHEPFAIDAVTGKEVDIWTGEFLD